MKFICLLPLRDEGDIIEHCLRSLLTWADIIYVFDTGSGDNAWEVVNEIALKDRRVLPLRREQVYFSETILRGWMFNQARKKMSDGDWFLRVDADEFHHIAPPLFVKRFMREHETLAYHQYYDFRLTESEVNDWQEGRETLADRARPIEDRRRYYTVSEYTEPRLCCYRETMRWPETVSFPFNAGYVARERLPIRHYPHRDPLQLQRRCRLRALMMADPVNRRNWSEPGLHHWSETEWRKLVLPNDFPALKHWKPGTELQLVHQLNHLKQRHIRAMQRVMHATALPLLDRLRPGFSADATPQPISPLVQQQLSVELKVRGG